jgi:hypothetical protein
VTSFSTPEEAARGRLREEYVRVVGVAIRGDQAVVAQVMNADGYPAAYEGETAMCYRTGDGWEEASSDNGDTTFIPTGEDRCTVVWWSEAPEGATAARLRLGDQEQTVPVKDGFFFVAFDDVPWHDFEAPRELAAAPARSLGLRSQPDAGGQRRLDWFHERPSVEEWIGAGDEGAV